MNVAYLNSKDNSPESDMLKFRDFYVKNEKGFLLFSLDKRSAIFKDLLHSKKVEFCWYFPLSREKFRIKSDLHNFNLDSYSDQSEDSLLPHEVFKGIWEKDIDKEEKKLFKELQPDTKKLEVNSKQIDDINDFNTPNVDSISSNFAIIVAEVQEGKT